MGARCCHVVGDGLGPVGCGVGVLCQLACPSRRPSSFPRRSRWVVVGRSRTARRSQLLMCEGCLMARCGVAQMLFARRHAARPSPTNASKRQPLRPTSMCPCPPGQVCWNPQVPCPGVDSRGARFEEPARYRGRVRAASGGSFVADGCWRARASLSLWHSTLALAMFARVSTRGRASSYQAPREF